MESLLDTISTYKVSSYTGIEDSADKASFLFSFVIMIVCTVIVTTNSYFLDPISCYIPVTIDNDFDKYVSNYCWVHGTIPIQNRTDMPKTKNGWLDYDAHRRINYYQWVPLVLALQGILYYLPRLLWQAIVNGSSGTDLEGVVVSAKNAVKELGEDKVKAVGDIAECLEDMFFQNRYIPRGSKNTNARRRISGFCNIKQTGIFLFSVYFMIKLLYLLNAIGQLFIMQKFLSMGSKTLSIAFGWQLLQDFKNGIYWQENLMFPRVTYCFIGNIQTQATKNHYMAQCALPINMINEKIYIFLWFWTIGIIIVTICSVPIWIMRITFLNNRRKFIKKFLKLKSTNDYVTGTKFDSDATQIISMNRGMVNHFINAFLRTDGVFILHIMSMNAGEMITSDIVMALWKLFQDKYKNCDFRKGIIEMNPYDDDEIESSDDKQQFL